VVAASSIEGMSGGAFVNLKLSFDRKDPVHFCLRAEDFYTFMGEMEQLKNSLQVLSVSKDLK